MAAAVRRIAKQLNRAHKETKEVVKAMWDGHLSHSLQKTKLDLRSIVDAALVGYILKEWAKFGQSHIKFYASLGKNLPWLENILLSIPPSNGS